MMASPNTIPMNLRIHLTRMPKPTVMSMILPWAKIPTSFCRLVIAVLWSLGILLLLQIEAREETKHRRIRRFPTINAPLHRT
jgi:hypothetical protein